MKPEGIKLPEKLLNDARFFQIVQHRFAHLIAFILLVMRRLSYWLHKYFGVSVLFGVGPAASGIDSLRKMHA